VVEVQDNGGGGGAGGYRESNVLLHQVVITSPLASATALPVSVTAYPITVGGGGAGLSLISDGNVGVKFNFFNYYISRWRYGAGGVHVLILC
jgi:hypothetical protein